MNIKDIVIRDPFILRDDLSHQYYLYGTTKQFDGQGFYCYQSIDLVNFEGPYKVFAPKKDFWGTKQYWAPEVYFINGKYYMLATFKADDHVRSCQMLISESPKGPFEVYSDILTPPDYESLDATLCFDKDGNPFIIFCHEWLQTKIGEMCRQEISKDFKHRVGEPVCLFKGDDAQWVATDLWFYPERICITDGPFLYKKGNNRILLWSSYVNKEDYGVGYVKIDDKGNVISHSQKQLPIFDGGHSMVFTSFEGKDYMALHIDNKKDNHESLKIIPVGFNKEGEFVIYE